MPLQESQPGNQQEGHIDLNDDLTTYTEAGGGNDILDGFGDEFGDLVDIFNTLSPGGSPGASPKHLSSPNSPMMDGRHSPTPRSSKAGGGSNTIDPQDEPGNLLMQPLAMGYYISTAPTGPLPHWIFSSCPHMEKACPICFKVCIINRILKYLYFLHTKFKSSGIKGRLTNCNYVYLITGCPADSLSYCTAEPGSVHEVQTEQKRSSSRL